MDSLTITSTPPKGDFLVLVVPEQITRSTQVNMQDLARAAIVLTADGRCLKNRYASEGETVVKVVT
jgi:hypothetical protein